MGKLTKNILLLLVISISLSCISCDHMSIGNTLATEREKQIVDQMGCWSSAIREFTINDLFSGSDKTQKEIDDLNDEWLEYSTRDNANGRKSLLNDTIFLSAVRSDSLYQTLYNQRMSIAKPLVEYRAKLPEFAAILENISDNVIEYRYFESGSFGLCETSIEDERLKNYKFHFNNYNELLKEAYFKNTTNSLSEEELFAINDLLKEVEKIDRHIWCVPYYKETKAGLVARELEKEKNRRIDSLIK